ncbi:MAG: hypothetical protein ACLUHJ_00395 [Ruminococcus sp.]
MEKQIYMTRSSRFRNILPFLKVRLNRFVCVFYHCRDRASLCDSDRCVDMVFCCNPGHPYAEITVQSCRRRLCPESNTSVSAFAFCQYNPVFGSADIMSSG